MWFTARTRQGPSDGRGVIGTAWSDDLVHWIIEPPLTPPGDFGEVEVPQYLSLGGRHYLLFSSSAARTSAARLTALAAQSRNAETGTHYFVAESADGPWTLAPPPFLASTESGLYAGRAVEGPDGAMLFMGFIGTRADGYFVGGISDPIAISVQPDGRMVLDQARSNEEEVVPASPRAGAAARR
jgi:beta-fructofuranosidase